MKILAICSSLDLRHPFSCTPAWWQLLKGLYEIGVEVIATPYQGQAIESLWWKAYHNPCQIEGALFKRARDLVRRVSGSEEIREENTRSGESWTDRAIRTLANRFVRPRWQKHLCRILDREGDVDAILMLTVPLNHLTGLPTYIKGRYNVPIIYYDGDVPESLPSFQGFASGFRIYQGANLTEYDGFISNSKGGVTELERMGARNVRVLYWGADPDLFSPLEIEQDIDVFFYGHGCEYRREWIESMITGPSRRMNNTRFAVRGSALGDVGNAEQLPYASFSKLREYCCRSKINLNITRKAHASVYASSSCRPFELAAMGCCVVSNPWNGLEEWFEPGKEIVVVHSQQEALETYRWLLDSDDQRLKIGRAAHQRVVHDHTCRQRAHELAVILGRF